MLLKGRGMGVFLKSTHEADLQAQSLSKDGHEYINRDGCPDLGLHRVLAGAARVYLLLAANPDRQNPPGRRRVMRAYSEISRSDTTAPGLIRIPSRARPPSTTIARKCIAGGCFPSTGNSRVSVTKQSAATS